MVCWSHVKQKVGLVVVKQSLVFFAGDPSILWELVQASNLLDHIVRETNKTSDYSPCELWSNLMCIYS